MNRVCGGLDGGWMRVADLDMRNSSSQCPSGLRERVHPDHRLCGMNVSTDCSQEFFETNVLQYDQVCGKIVAYQVGSIDAFSTSPNKQGIDQGYVDGISLTYSSNPRKHIWTFAAAADEYSRSDCPCVNIGRAANANPISSFIGNDYFCDTAAENRYVNGLFYADDPLWDGAGCGPANFCCSLNNPPWFFKQLQSSTSEDIEMRVCNDEGLHNEDIHIEQIEIYVR